MDGRRKRRMHMVERKNLWIKISRTSIRLRVREHALWNPKNFLNTMALPCRKA